MKNVKKYIDKYQALLKLQKYCAYQDRCHQEVRNKLIEIGCYGDDLEEVITELIAERFLDEERFARSYARGKFRLKRWGRDRIKRELKSRQISPYLLRKAMEEITEADYLAALEEILLKKAKELTKETNPYKRNQKLAKFAVYRGFEAPLVWEMVKSLFPVSD